MAKQLKTDKASASLNVEHAELELHRVVPCTAGSHGGPFIITLVPGDGAPRPHTGLFSCVRH